MHTRTLTAATLAVAIALAMFTISKEAVRPEPLPPSHVAAAGSPAAPPVSTDRDRQRREIAGLWAELKNQGDVLDAVEAQLDARPIDVSDEPPALSEAEMDAAMLETQRAFTAIIAAEPTDTRWARQAETTIAARVAALGPLVRSVSEVQCRSTMCSVELRYDQGGADPVGLAEQIAGLPPWPTNSFFRVGLGEDPVAFLVFSREGHVLPQPG